MRTTPEKLAELKTMAQNPYRSCANQVVLNLIADLEEARGMAVALAPDALREAEERKNIDAGLEVVWQGRMRDAETAHQAELAATRKLLAYTKEALLAERSRREHFLEMANGLGCDSLTDVFKMVSSLRNQLAEAQSRDGSTAPVAAIKFSLKTDCGDQFLRCWVEGDFDAIRSEWPEAPEAVFIGADPLHPNTQQTSTAALNAAIAEAIEPYRKDAACWQFARKELSWSRAWFEQIKWAMYIEMDAPNIAAGRVTDDSVARELDAAVLAAIAAKGESE